MRNIQRLVVLAATVLVLGLGAHTGAHTGAHRAAHADAPAPPCRAHFPGGHVPAKTQAWDIDLCKHADGQAAYAIRFDSHRRTPDFVAYKLTPDLMARLGKRTRPRFRPDALLPPGVQARDRTYVRSGFSRGHMVPAHDMSWNEAAYDATFDLSNVVPQIQHFNAGPWLGLETAVRDLVARNATVLWTITGVYGVHPDRPTIGQGPHAPTVPACFFKILVAPSPNGGYRALAVVLRYDDFRKRRDWVSGITTVARIRERTGIDFLDGLRLDAAFDAAFWGATRPETPADCA